MNPEKKEKQNRLGIEYQNAGNSNGEKEKFLYLFVRMCSDNIADLEEYQKTLNKLLMEGRKEKILNFTRSRTLVDLELHKLYAAFDAAFLDLFPDFIEKFNLLLREGEGYELKSKGSLGPELRVFALFRLGMRNSAEIAKFLRCRAHTVYNYRTIVKSKAISKENFEDQVLELE